MNNVFKKMNNVFKLMHNQIMNNWELNYNKILIKLIILERKLNNQIWIIKFWIIRNE